MNYKFSKHDPVPYNDKSIYDNDLSVSKELMLLDVEAKYQFLDKSSKDIFHSYPLCADDHILHCGGYLDKMLKWRDPKLLKFLKKNGISKRSFKTDKFKILQTRSPQIDLLILDLLKYFYSKNKFSSRVRFFDHGCSVSEHLDLLKLMVGIFFNEEFNLENIIDYTGMDHSSLCLMASRLFHETFDKNFYNLICSEGSDLNFNENHFDISLSVGVCNHVKEPVKTLKKIFESTKYFSVLALWVTNKKDGFWRISHGQSPYYFFSREDLNKIVKSVNCGSLFFSEFINDEDSSQLKSYVGVSEEQLRETGCYHMVFTKVKDCKYLDNLNKLVL
tara:strand:- start:46494 stop:47489 length:996 start_codon:yes stop_codon:yes gene_type:complete